MVRIWKPRKCPNCEIDLIDAIEEKEELSKLLIDFDKVNSSKTGVYQFAKEIKLILKSPQDAYQKKVALFNFVKNLEIEDIEPDENKRINCLLEGKLYNELSKQKMKEYKKLTAESFSKK